MNAVTPLVPESSTRSRVKDTGRALFRHIAEVLQAQRRAAVLAAAESDDADPDDEEDDD